MGTPNNLAGRNTEIVMAALKSANVLKDDEPNYPVHYNRAYSSVYEALLSKGPRTDFGRAAISAAVNTTVDDLQGKQ